MCSSGLMRSRGTTTVVATVGRPQAADLPALVDPAASVRCAVVVIAHDGAAFIERCLRSLIEGGSEPSDIVVVDNASRDRTVDLVRRVHPDIAVIRSNVNVGYGHGANLGIAATSLEYVAVLNQDVVVSPGWLRPLLRAMQDDESVALATPKILLSTDTASVNACGGSPHYTGITTCRGYGRPSAAYSSSEVVGAVSGAAFVVRRDVFDAVGGFDPLFFMYLEETDLSLRVALAGYRILCVPSTTVIHDFRASFPLDKIHWLERNRFLLLAKLFRWRTLLVLMPALAVTELLVLSYAATRGPSIVLAKLRAYVWAARTMPAIGSARRRTQRLRRVSDRRLLASMSDDLELSELRHPAADWVEMLANPFYRTWATVVRRLMSW
jgi:GT2 family glycosyltransferase